MNCSTHRGEATHRGGATHRGEATYKGGATHRGGATHKGGATHRDKNGQAGIRTLVAHLKNQRSTKCATLTTYLFLLTEIQGNPRTSKKR